MDTATRFVSLIVLAAAAVIMNPARADHPGYYERTGKLAGRVTRADGGPVEGAIVEVKVTARAARADADSEKPNRFAAGTELRADGRFRLHLPPGEYVVSARRDKLAASEIVSVSAHRQTNVSLKLGGRRERPQEDAGADVAAESGANNGEASIGQDGGGKRTSVSREKRRGAPPVPRNNKPLPRREPPPRASRGR